MTVRNLEYLFKPRSVALVGASNRPESVGSVLATNLLGAGFNGPVLLVNPKHDTIQGERSYPDVAALPECPDLGIVCTPPETVPQLVDALARRGTKAAIVISAGFGERQDARGRQLRQAVLDAARPTLLRVVGPNCLGIMVPGAGLNASFAQLNPNPGHLAFVAQSGAIVTSVLDWAHPQGIGFSHLVSLGDMADVDFGDMLDYLANDRGTRAILLYIEAVTHARKFMSAARAAARMKPVLVVKAGRHAEGARAAASHTGALAGADAVYDTAFRRAGMLRVLGLDELFAAVEVLALGQRPRGDRLAILTNGGGIGVLATDALIDHAGRLAELAPQTVANLDAVLPPTWSKGNPIDIIGDATGERYAAALEALWQDKGIDAILVLNCPTAVASAGEAAQAIIETSARHTSARATSAGPALLTCWVGEQSAREARRALVEHAIPTYTTPSLAVRGFMYLVDYFRSQEALMETPPSIPEMFTPDAGRARIPVDRAISERREWLTEPEAKEVCAAYGIPVVATRTARSPEEAASIAADIGGPVALKILSKSIVHKSDLGGVVLDLAGPRAVREAAAAMQERIAQTRPDVILDGFTVEPMVHRPGAHELIVGAVTDPQFGPVVLFGHGGTAVELLDDKALGLPPLNMRLARELISRTRVGRLLEGFRDRPPSNLDAIALTLIRTAQLVIDFAEVVEFEINPLLADDYGVMALDARLRVAPASVSASERLSIRPYPKELEEDVPLGDGRTLLLRPILPEDEASLQTWFTQLDPESIRLRFFVPKKTLSHVQAARFTQIDYDREMALVLTRHGTPGRTPIYGVVRIGADPDNEEAEYAIIVDREMTGLGLGIVLMRRIIDYAQNRGIKKIVGDVLRENTTMLKLCEVFGFTKSAVEDSHDVVRVSKILQQ